MHDLASHSILVTGASTGIGEACVRELTRRGCLVFAGVRSDADGQRLRQTTSERLVPLRLEVTDTAEIAAAAAEIHQRLAGRGLDGLVNNAGIVVTGPLELVPLEKLRQQLEVNVLGQVAVTQAMLPLLRLARGRIVNMGSVSGRIAAPYLGPYCASKYALEALTDSLRLELRHWGVGVSIVEPGSVQTPIWGKAFGFAESLASQTDAAKLALYEHDFEVMQKASQEMADRGMPVEVVVQAVMHALFARRPKTRYLLGRGWPWILGALKFAPAWLRDWLMLRSLRLPRALP